MLYTAKHSCPNFQATIAQLLTQHNILQMLYAHFVSGLRSAIRGAKCKRWGFSLKNHREVS
jgi:hypothetical protein